MREPPGGTPDLGDGSARGWQRPGRLLEPRPAKGRRVRQRGVRLSLTRTQRRLARALGTRLPGAAAPITPPETETLLAAVSVIISPEPDSVLLIRRAKRATDPWSGHIGLPGGRHDPADADLTATAIRETCEEVGLSLEPGDLLGPLDDVWPRTPFPRVVVVRPFVFGIRTRPPVALSDEVAEAFWVPLERLREPGVYRDAVISLRGQDRVFPGYHLGSDLVWGLTERILSSVLHLI